MAGLRSLQFDTQTATLQSRARARPEELCSLYNDDRNNSHNLGH